MLIEFARTAAKRGTCLRLQVGAVISRDGRPLSIGYNGAPTGMSHCNAATCDPHQPCTWASHAEQNAIDYAARKGISTEAADLHLTDSPCPTCARSIINAGIRRVVYEREYRDPEGLRLLKLAAVRCERALGSLDTLVY